jgi:two-component system phosphate regulon sensor histidine kinase PhoR
LPDSDLPLHLADLADVGLLYVDDEDVIRRANETVHRLLRRRGSLVGRTVLEAFLDHRVTELLGGARATGNAHREISLGGEPQRTLLLNATREDGAQPGTWVAVRDLSELRRLQRIRTEFIDNLSHELRTPLTNVRLLAETLAMEIESVAVSPRIRESVARIDIETSHLATMVTELLDLARIEQGDAVMRRDRVDLGKVIESLVGRLGAAAERKSIELKTALPESVEERTVTGDEERLERLLVNIVHNAIKFSVVGGQVAISLRPDPNDPGWLVVEVDDDGPGIPRHALERIFERFYKVDRARTREESTGTGLGLSIARHIAEAHGGRIWAESVEGEGAQFFVALPRG